jgi:tetratricopeptide (TPR) repeat protein
LQYAYNFKIRRPFSSIFWIFAGNKERFKQDYMNIAKGLKLPGYNDPEVDVLRLVKSSLEKSDSKDWLMIIDNADDLSLLDSSSEAESFSILKYIPDNAAGSIIYTTRSKKNALRLTGEGIILQISEMSMQDSKALLRSKLRAETSDEESWTDLLEVLERLPLAIVQAASYIRQNSWSVSRYLRHFQSQDGNASIQFLQHDFRDKTREHTVANPVFKTWMVTVRQLEDQHPRAAETLWLMAFYNRQNIPRYLLLKAIEPSPSNLQASDRRSDAQGVSHHEVREDAELFLDLAISTLVSYSFINVSDTERGENYTLHRLVHKFTWYWLKDCRRTADSWATKALEFLSANFPSPEYENWTKAAELLPHVEVILSYQPAYQLPAYELGVLLTAAANYLRERAQFPLAEDYIRRAITTLKVGLGPENPITMEAFYCLAHICHGIGRFREAEDTWRMLIRFYSHSVGESQARVFLASSLLGATLRVQKRYDEAEELVTRAILGLEKLRGSDVDHLLLESKRILSTILGDRDRFDESIQIQRDILALAQKEYGPEHPISVRAQQDIAVTLTNMGERGEAKRMSQDALKLNEKLYGLDHPRTMNSLHVLATLLGMEGNHTEAEGYFRLVLEYYLCYLGNDKQTMMCLTSLAVSLENQQLYDEAAKYYRQAYEKIRTTPQINVLEACKLLDDLARLSRLQAGITDAREELPEVENNS